MLSTSPAGLRAEFNANGSLRRFDAGSICLPLFVGNEIEGGPTNVYLRRHAEVIEWTPLLGPGSPTQFELDAQGALRGVGQWQGIEYVITLRLAQSESAWFWHVWLRNTQETPQRLDLTYTQDLALSSYGAIRLNEFYVSQYLDHTPLRHPSHGWLLATRQNQAVDARNPWCLIGSLRAASDFATDSLQFAGLALRGGEAPIGMTADLGARRLQHEHAMAIIRDTPLSLAPQASGATGFFGLYVAHHPEATAEADLQRVDALMRLPEAAPSTVTTGVSGSLPSQYASLFSSAPQLPVQDMDEARLRSWFAAPWRHEERDANGALLSFFYGQDRHVVLRAKELSVLRPHGHILRTGRHLTPDETALTSTVWMSGVFHSMLTQGHVSINRYLSTVHSYLSLFQSHGLRVFVRTEQGWQMLGVPSAFEMSPEACRWLYRRADGTIEVRAAAHSDPHALTLTIQVHDGEPRRFLLSQHVALNGDDGSAPGPASWRREAQQIVLEPAPGSDLAGRFPHGAFALTPQSGTQFEQLGGDELLFADGQSHGQPFLCMVTAPAGAVGLSIQGRLVDAAVPPPLRIPVDADLFPQVTMTPATSDEAGLRMQRLAEALPWFAHNAWVHYLAPRGLEQYSGGGWGTRDVCQGPVELLLALGRTAALRDLLLRVMANQNPDGDWPQWFMFFERERAIRPGDSHGDIVFWPLLALAQYLIASGDASILDERVRLFDQRGPDAGELLSVWQHVQRALDLISRRVVAGTALAAYGHGDWNDSLQPADPTLPSHMCSAWTVTLHVQTFTTLSHALRAIDRAADAPPLEASLPAIQRDFQRLLLVDGVLTGYAVFEEAGVRYLLHPRDTTTGLKYSALAMIHAILEDLLSPDQVRAHLGLLQEVLSGPDGVRLFDRPMPYHGGRQRIFQRAETATYFGREIGLMYTHAHLRYAQALAHVGEAQRFYRALCQANPIGIQQVVASATSRQSNCYYSSSDAAFADRYEASEQYQRVTQGTIGLDGGWRVYSSGAGIAVGLVMRRLLGLNYEAEALLIDPVMPPELDGLQVETQLLDRPFKLHYRIGSAGCGVNAVTLNDHSLPFASSSNRYRRGGALISWAQIRERLDSQHNVLRIEIG
jgi:1,2-beta-oligoglucan phosphorylase